MKTTVHAYRFDTSKDAEKAAWEELRERLKASHPRCMESWGGRSHYRPDLDGLSVELEAKHLFDNQWNTAPIDGISDKGLRLFDWALDAPPAAGGDRFIKRGHYLDQTDEMREVRRNTNVCGYCGHQEEAARGAVFCPKCIGSAHLKEDDLHLTRMRPVDARFNEPRAPLTEAERAHLLPLYLEAQKKGTGERSDAYQAAKRAAIQTKTSKAITAARTECEGMLWLLDRGLSLENVIFYAHTGRFCFGWRSKLSPAQLSALLEALGAEFPFSYDIETADGRKLSAER